MLGKKSLFALICGIVILSFGTDAFSYGCMMNTCGGCMSLPCGWYIELNAGTTRFSGDEFQLSTSSNGIGVNGNLGYKFMPYFAIEGGYTRYADTKLEDDLNTRIATIEHDMYDIALKGILPILDSGFELFAKIGYQRLNAKLKTNEERRRSLFRSGLSTAILNRIDNSSRTHYDYFIGIGGQYYFCPSLAVVVQWQRAHGDSGLGTVDLISGGISFIFNW